MVSLTEVAAQSIGKSAASVVKPVALDRGTLVTRDLRVMQNFCETLLGMECVRTAPDRMLVRHKGDRAAKDYWVLEVREVAEIAHPQRMINHWGFFVPTRAEVDRAAAVAAARKDEFRLRRVHPVKANHGSYSFYFEDLDSNWWEIECRPDEISYAASVAAGDPK
jgi:catechol-2,3-dioxygenase